MKPSGKRQLVRGNGVVLKSTEECEDEEEIDPLIFTDDDWSAEFAATHAVVKTMPKERRALTQRRRKDSSLVWKASAGLRFGCRETVDDQEEDVEILSDLDLCVPHDDGDFFALPASDDIQIESAASRLIEVKLGKRKADTSLPSNSNTRKRKKKKIIPW